MRYYINQWFTHDRWTPGDVRKHMPTYQLGTTLKRIHDYNFDKEMKEGTLEFLDK